MATRDLLAFTTTRLLLGLALVALAVACELGRVSMPLVDTLDRYLYDTRLRLQPVRPNSRVVIVDVDERSLREQGRWPWSRETIARLTRTIAHDGGARALGFDMVFAEPQAPQDAALVRALDGLPVALGYYFSSELGAVSTGLLPEPVWSAGVLRERRKVHERAVVAAEDKEAGLPEGGCGRRRGADRMRQIGHALPAAAGPVAVRVLQIRAQRLALCVGR